MPISRGASGYPCMYCGGKVLWHVDFEADEQFLHCIMCNDCETRYSEDKWRLWVSVIEIEDALDEVDIEKERDG